MKLNELHIIMDRKQSLSALTKFMNDNLVPEVRSVRIDHCPLDKKGDIVDLAVYVFNKTGGYDILFPKRIRLPLKVANKVDYVSLLSKAVEKIITACPELTTISDAETAGKMMLDLAPMLERELEDIAMDKLSHADRFSVLLDRSTQDGSLQNIMDKMQEEREAARARLEEAWKEFDAMSDEQFADFMVQESKACVSEEYLQSMRNEWALKGVQYDVTQKLHDAMSLIMERGDGKIPTWGEKDFKETEGAGFYCEFKTYRGFTVCFKSCAVDSGYDLFNENGEHLITT